MPAAPNPGRSIVTRRALLDIIRTAVLGSYGVTGLSERSWPRRLLTRLGFPGRSITLRLEDGIEIELSITVAHGLPVAEVVRQVESAVRYAIRQALGRDVAHLVVHVDGLGLPSLATTGQDLARDSDTAPQPVPPPAPSQGADHHGRADGGGVRG